MFVRVCVRALESAFVFVGRGIGMTIRLMMLRSTKCAGGRAAGRGAADSSSLPVPSPAAMSAGRSEAGNRHRAGGVYYTPVYIVDYIVRHTVGKLLGKPGAISRAAKLRLTLRPPRRHVAAGDDVVHGGVSDAGIREGDGAPTRSARSP